MTTQPPSWRTSSGAPPSGAVATGPLPSGGSPTLRGPAAYVVDVPHGLEALADVFLEKTRAEPIEVVDVAGHHWLLSWAAAPEPQVAVHALERRTVLPALAEVTAHDLAALLAWALEPRPRTPLQPVPDRVWRLLGLDHPLAAAVRRSRVDVLPLRAHGLPEGFAVEAARADLRLYVQDHRRPMGDDLLQIILWSWSSRGVWPPMRRAIPPGDLIERLVIEVPPQRQVEELAALLRRLARMPGSQMWSLNELEELQAVLRAFALPTPPVELVDVDRDGVVSISWRGDRLVAMVPMPERMSARERETSARMLDGLLPGPVVERLRGGAEGAGTEPAPRPAAAGRAAPAEAAASAVLGENLPDAPPASAGRHPTTRRSAAALGDGEAAAVAGAPAQAAARAATPADVARRSTTPLAVSPVPTQAARSSADTGAQRQQSIAATRRQPLPDAPSNPDALQATASWPAPAPALVRAAGMHAQGRAQATATPQPAGAVDAGDDTYAAAPSASKVAAETDAWLRGSVTPAGTVAEPSDLRALLAADASAHRGADGVVRVAGAGQTLPGGVALWTFAAGAILGLAVGYLAGSPSAPPVTVAPTPAPSAAVAPAPPAVAAAAAPAVGVGDPGAAAAAAAGADEAAGEGTDEATAAVAATGDAPDEPVEVAAGSAPSPTAREAAGAPAAAPAAPAAAAPAPGVAIGPGFAALAELSLWDGNSAPWAEAGVSARCNAFGDLELRKGVAERVLVCGPFYSAEGHLVRYASCADKPARCVLLGAGDARGVKPWLCTPRSARPLVRQRARPADPDRFSSDVALRRLFDAGRRARGPLCPEPAAYAGRFQRRWLDAGPPPVPAGALPAAAAAPTGVDVDVDD